MTSADHLRRVADEIADGVIDRTLPKSRWTHEGHLLACASLVRRRGAPEALVILRRSIPPYNEATGVSNTPAGGYHDTITVYYTWAIGQLVEAGLSNPAIIGHPDCTREALLGWWDRETLMSSNARARFVAPNLVGDGRPAPSEWLQPAAV